MANGSRRSARFGLILSSNCNTCDVSLSQLLYEEFKIGNILTHLLVDNYTRSFLLFGSF